MLHLQIVALLLQVSGVEGIMSAYAMALHNVALAGPTLFGPVINKAAEIASRSLSTRQNKYFILLIITVKAVLACHLTAQFFNIYSGLLYYIFAFPGWSYYRFAGNKGCDC